MANADLVEAYWRQYQLSQSQDPVDLAMADSLFHVWEEVEEAAQFGIPEVVDLLVALADAAPNDLALATLGAGPVEDLITSHGEEFVETIDEAARRSESFGKLSDVSGIKAQLMNRYVSGSNGLDHLFSGNDCRHPANGAT